MGRSSAIARAAGASRRRPALGSGTCHRFCHSVVARHIIYRITWMYVHMYYKLIVCIAALECSRAGSAGAGATCAVSTAAPFLVMRASCRPRSALIWVYFYLYVRSTAPYTIYLARMVILPDDGALPLAWHPDYFRLRRSSHACYATHKYLCIHM